MTETPKSPMPSCKAIVLSLLIWILILVTLKAIASHEGQAGERPGASSSPGLETPVLIIDTRIA